MNTYDPADRMVYVRMAREWEPYAHPVTRTRRVTRLPRGYANKSLRTRLRG